MEIKLRKRPPFRRLDPLESESAGKIARPTLGLNKKLGAKGDWGQKGTGPNFAKAAKFTPVPFWGCYTGLFNGAPRGAARSSALRSQPARFAAASYELSRNSMRASSGDDSARRSSYFRMNSPSAVLYPAVAGRIVALSRPVGAGAALHHSRMLRRRSRRFRAKTLRLSPRASRPRV